MENTSVFQPPNGLEPGIKIAGLVAPFQSGALPKDFPERLEMLREASELTWNDFADAAGIDRKRVHRWRRRTRNGKPVKPIKPDGDGYHAIVNLAAFIPGGLDILMGDGFQLYLWRDWQDRQD